MLCSALQHYLTYEERVGFSKDLSESRYQLITRLLFTHINSLNHPIPPPSLYPALHIVRDVGGNKDAEDGNSKDEIEKKAKETKQLEEKDEEEKGGHHCCPHPLFQTNEIFAIQPSTLKSSEQGVLIIIIAKSPNRMQQLQKYYGRN